MRLHARTGVIYITAGARLLGEAGVALQDLDAFNRPSLRRRLDPVLFEQDDIAPLDPGVRVVDARKLPLRLGCKFIAVM